MTLGWISPVIFIFGLNVFASNIHWPIKSLRLICLKIGWSLLASARDSHKSFWVMVISLSISEITICMRICSFDPLGKSLISASAFPRKIVSGVLSSCEASDAKRLAFSKLWISLNLRSSNEDTMFLNSWYGATKGFLISNVFKSNVVIDSSICRIGRIATLNTCHVISNTNSNNTGST